MTEPELSADGCWNYIMYVFVCDLWSMPRWQWDSSAMTVQWDLRKDNKQEREESDDKLTF